MDRLNAIFELRDMLREMERDIGLEDLRPAEKDVFQAAHTLTDEPGQMVQSDQIRRHPLVESLTQATFHRALKSLLELGFLERPDGARAKHYVVRQDLLLDS
ncbi:hypothetical protein [Tritonibacter horizontis]|uniref:MarR family protein n=1 Tax=Tritonibacter horizontis TaxID=1768241 RepID=A0A132BTZ2_9RHOB|nr:hypothetical protein [Tritonibacter horizontis]KUP91220.1 hypothetical protein TRIHO_39070 [Tritonibacter horizontis]